MNTLPKELLRRLRQLMRQTTRHRHFHRHGVWLLGLAIFLTSVTIAAIIPRGGDVPPAGSLIPATPPQTVLLGNAIVPAVSNGLAPSPAITEPPATKSSNRETWTEITVRKGDTLSDILKRQGYDGNEISRVIQSNPGAHVFRQVHPGQTLRVRAEAGRPWQELVYESDPGEAFHLIRQEGRFDLTKEIRSFETRNAHVSGAIESSLFEDGQDAGLSDALIMKLAEIFGWDIDFALDLRSGDGFSVIHEEKYWQGQKVADGPILAAEFINQGRVFRAIAYRDVNGYTSYFTPEGMSMRRPFLRTPVEFSRITSRFSTGRFHPILKKWRAHHGVDYGAPVGTPVRSTSSGRILSLGWNGGYGKRIVIRHNATYSTVYAHLSRYNTSLHVGSFVDQGQTIGYVGATGLASGPHLHYEFQVNGEHRNPLTFRFPGSTLIAREHRDEFTRLAKTWNERLDIIGRGTQIAASR
jgi:murein DD-endopeptidase MepM/ murein hydrolase activator NlpD